MEPIKDYAIIGDCRSAALISRKGSLDWLCWPRFDSPTMFGALLDDDAGYWSVAPTAACRTQRRYIPGTNVLETRFFTERGTLLLTDLMPVGTNKEKGERFTPDNEVLRIATCERGTVEVQMHFVPRPGYAKRPPRVRDGGGLGVRLETRDGLLTLRTDLRCDVSSHGAHGRATLRAGESLHFSLTFSTEAPAVLCEPGAESNAALERTVRWWKSWCEGIEYDGPCRDAVVRSALALRLMVFAPSGAVIAAPTTSLPERMGGDLNWDYRFCWLRDAALTMRALFGLGLREEAQAFGSWTLHATRLTRPKLDVLYDLFGRPPRKERLLDHWTGYRGSRPVRVGNAAHDQFQLDMYGELIEAAAIFVREGEPLDHDSRKMLRSLGTFVCRNWQRPDEGIWEPRSGPVHHTHSRVLCWTALDRLIELHEKLHLPPKDLAMFRKNRDMIRAEVEARGFNPRLNSYVSVLDGDELDASLLLLAWYGFETPDSARMRGTYDAINRELGAGNGLLYRHRDGMTPGEGAFGICSFWNVECLALGTGTLQEAAEMFGSLTAYANDVGLFAEEIDPDTGDALGNFPQAFTHVGLVNAALTLQRRLEKESGAPRPSTQTAATQAEKVSA